MGVFRFPQLVETLIACLERSSASVIPIEVSERRPASVRVITGSATTECSLFLWNITGGGGGPDVRPESERRIQITGVDRIPLLPGVRTLLGGWSAEFGVYAFWDARRHTGFSTQSPSVQVDANTLESAGAMGLATQLRPTREGQEVVVAVAEGSLLWYVQHGLSLHNAGEDALSVDELIDAPPEDERIFIDTSASESQSSRRFDLVETLRAYRDARFRPLVLQAYSYKCAVCNCDLKLVDAAHIIPVSHARSTNEVTNGIALCRLHHGAYDNALLGVQSDLRVVVNPRAVERLREIGLSTGISQFARDLPERIRVPTVIEARPRPENLSFGLELRGWPMNLIA